jgi:DNA topoisomerase-1
VSEPETSPRNGQSEDPARSARTAGLRYVDDSKPGIRRRRCGRGFTYLAPGGGTIRDREVRRRIEALAIPPAWEEVWICPDPRGHLQATGRDARGRKQYRYHPRWREVRDRTKFERMIPFAEALPALRRRVEADLGRRGLPPEKVLAAVVRLLEETLIRVGNPEYARDNGSYGLTTLRRRHVRVDGTELRFRFLAKSGRERQVSLADRRLAGIVRRCRELPGYELFKYLDEAGEPRTVESDDVNDYLRRATGGEFTAKDFRTWAGTVRAAALLREQTGFESAAEADRRVVDTVKQVAERLGNRPATCRKFYVHPAVIEAFGCGALEECAANAAGRRGARDRSRDARVARALLRGAAGESG